MPGWENWISLKSVVYWNYMILKSNDEAAMTVSCLGGLNRILFPMSIYAPHCRRSMQLQGCSFYSVAMVRAAILQFIAMIP